MHYCTIIGIFICASSVHNLMLHSHVDSVQENDGLREWQKTVVAVAVVQKNSFLKCWSTSPCLFLNISELLLDRTHHKNLDSATPILFSCLTLPSHFLNLASLFAFHHLPFLCHPLALICLGQGLWKVEHLSSHQHCVPSEHLHMFSLFACLIFLAFSNRDILILEGGDWNKTCLSVTLSMKDAAYHRVLCGNKIQFNWIQYSVQLSLI